MSPINPAKLQKQLEHKALEEKKSREEAIANIQKIHKLIEEARKAGIDVSEFQNGLKDVQMHMRERKFSEAAKKSREVIDSIHSSVKDALGGISKALKDALSRANALGMDVSRQEGILEKITEMEEKGEYFVALKSVAQARSSLKSAISSTASSILEETERLIKALSETVDTSEPQKLLKDAEKKMEQGDTDAALELCEKAKNMVQGAAEDAAESLLTDAEINITILERMGFDTSKLRERIDAVKKAENPSEISEIMEIGRLARDEVKAGLKAQTEAMGPEIELIKGLGGDVSEIESMLKKASDNIEKNNLALSAETLEKAKKKAEETKFNIVVMSMNPAFSKMKSVSKIGADISEPEKLLVDARNALKIGEYRKAMELSKSCETKLDEISDAYRKTSELLPKLDKMFKESEKLGADTGDAKRFLVAVKQALSERDFVKAYTLAAKTMGALEQGKEEGIKQAITEGRRLMKMADEIGLDMAGEEVAFHEAEKSMESGDYIKARKFADDGLNEVKEKIRRQIDISFDDFQSEIDEMGAGADKKEISKVVSKGRKYLEFGDFSSAIQSMKDIDSKISELQKDAAKKAVEDAKAAAEEILSEEGVQDTALEDVMAEMLVAYQEEKYFDAMALSKKLQESANSLAKNLAQTAYKEAKSILAESKNLQGKVDIRKFNNMLLDSKAEFKKGNYLSSMKLSRQMAADMQASLSDYESALNSFNVAQELIKDARKKGMNVTAQAKKVFKAREMMNSGKYDEVIKLSERIVDELSGKMAKQSIDSRIKMLEAKLFSAKTMGMNLSGSEAKLADMKSLVSDGKAEEAESTIDALEKDVEESVREGLEKKITITDTLINDARDIGINVGKAEESLAVARDALNKGDYIEAYQYLEDAQKVIDDIKMASKKVAEKINDAHAKISEAESIRADVRNAKLVLDRAVEALKDNRAKESMKLAEECIEMVEKAEKEKVGRVILDFVNIIENSKKTGMDTSLAENLIHQANNSLERGKYQKALSLAMQSEMEMEKVELQKDIAEKAIKTLTEKIEELRRKGISVEDSLSTLNRAEGAYEAGAYIKSFEYTMAASEKLQELREMYDSVGTDLSELEERLQDARESHIDVVEVSEMYVSAKTALEQGRVEEARRTIKQALNMMDRTFLGHVDEILDYADAKIKYAKKMGGNVSEAETAIKEAKKIKQKDPSKALRLANGARAMVERSGTDTSFVDRAYSINFDIARAKRFGVNVKEAENLLKKAISGVDAGQEEAEETLKKADEEVKRALGKLTPEITMEIDAEGLEQDVWKDAVVKISNKGTAPAKDIKIDISGELEIEGLSALEEMDKDSDSQISVRIMAQKEGEIPVSVRISAKRLFDGKEFEFEHKQVLKTREKPKTTAGAKEVEAQEPEKCKFCNGTIKPGMKMIVCGGCGATYHVPCAKRIGTCKVCGASLEPKGKPKVARKKLAIKLG